jgi:hypothetical protein
VKNSTIPAVLGGVQLNRITQSPLGYAHFFRRLPRKIPEKECLRFGHLQKKSSAKRKLIRQNSHKFNVPAFFWLIILIVPKLLENSFFFK